MCEREVEEPDRGCPPDGLKKRSGRQRPRCHHGEIQSMTPGVGRERVRTDQSMAAQVEKARCSDQKGRGEQRSLARERATLLRPAWSHRSWLQGEGSANGEAARGGEPRDGPNVT